MDYPARMDGIQALECSELPLRFRRVVLTPEAVVGMSSTGLGKHAAIYVVTDSELETLAGVLPAGVLIDRGTKHPARPLAVSVGRQPGLVCLRAGYRLAGQAERGIRSLRERLGTGSPGSRYLIAVGPAIFEALWNRGSTNDRRRPTEVLTRPRGASEALDELLSIHPELHVPTNVEQSYIGRAPVARLVHFQIVLAANCGFPVLIEGATGTGKEIVARLIHQLRSGVNGKCVSVNCGGIPADLLESELFGHVRGSFTGAVRNKVGFWQDAQNGTLFLDEVGDLSPLHQVKVLRVLEDGQYVPVGSTRPLKSNARVISATNRNLEERLRSGRFRDDLYHRLAMLRIRTPNLEEHPEDIPDIARHIWKSIRLRREQVLSDEICGRLGELSYRGNVRELRAILAELAMVSYGKAVTGRMLSIVTRGRGSMAGDA
jgi:hypothetical protein